jgi:hypothetical protein
MCDCHRDCADLDDLKDTQKQLVELEISLSKRINKLEDIIQSVCFLWMIKNDPLSVSTDEAEIKKATDRIQGAVWGV